MFLLFAGLHLVFGPYALVQAYAWSTMLARYTSESGWLQGTKDTFSGEKPCELCCQIAKAKKEASGKEDPGSLAAAEAAAKAPKFVAANDFLLILPVEVDRPEVSFVRPLWPSGIGAHAPPTPPPRALA